MKSVALSFWYLFCTQAATADTVVDEAVKVVNAVSGWEQFWSKVETFGLPAVLLVVILWWFSRRETRRERRAAELEQRRIEREEERERQLLAGFKGFQDGMAAASSVSRRQTAVILAMHHGLLMEGVAGGRSVDELLELLFRNDRHCDVCPLVDLNEIERVEAIEQLALCREMAVPDCPALRRHAMGGGEEPS